MFLLRSHHLYLLFIHGPSSPLPNRNTTCNDWKVGFCVVHGIHKIVLCKVCNWPYHAFEKKCTLNNMLCEKAVFGVKCSKGFFDVEVYSYASYIQVSMPFLVHNTCLAFEEQLFLPTFWTSTEKDPVTYLSFITVYRSSFHQQVLWHDTAGVVA